MKPKALGILVCLVLCSFLVLFALPVVSPVQASSPTFTLRAAGSGTAEWTAADRHSGLSSANLTTTAAADWATVGMGYSIPMDNMTSLSFWYRHTQYNSECGPRLSLVVTLTNDTTYMAVTGCAVNSTLVWKNANAVSGLKDTDWNTTGTGNQIWWYGTWDGMNYNQIGGPITFAALKTTLSGGTVSTVAVYMGIVNTGVIGAGSAYIDDLEINGATYNLEPGGCFIATAAYGTPMAQQIQVLRDFRDKYLLTNPAGEDFVKFYYKVSPPMADFINEHPTLKPVVRAGLVPVLAMSTVAVKTTLVEKIAIVVGLALIAVALAVWATKLRGKKVD